MTNRFVTVLRRVVEDALPWFDRDDHDRKAARTERIRQTSIATRKWVERRERIIDEYLQASAISVRAGQAMVDETRRAGHGR